MAESSEHRWLVELITGYVMLRHATTPALIILSDRSGVSRELPPRIEGFIPDVYAADVPTTFMVIGEAKTEDDLETHHSHRQIAAFIRFLKATPNGTFVLAVPWRASASARDLLLSITSNIGAGNVELVLLDGVSPVALTVSASRC